MMINKGQTRLTHLLLFALICCFTFAEWAVRTAHSNGAISNSSLAVTSEETGV